jgi:hypothetical protein
MAQTPVTVAYNAEPDDTDEELARLTRELALDLREVGVVEYVAAVPEQGSKGVGEVVAATLAVFTAAEPTYVQALVETVVAFVRRHEGRRAQLKVGGIELAIDQPSRDEVVELIEMTRSAIERAAVETAEN